MEGRVFEEGSRWLDVIQAELMHGAGYLLRGERAAGVKGGEGGRRGGKETRNTVKSKNMEIRQ